MYPYKDRASSVARITDTEFGEDLGPAAILSVELLLLLLLLLREEQRCDGDGDGGGCRLGVGGCRCCGVATDIALALL